MDGFYSARTSTNAGASLDGFLTAAHTWNDIEAINSDEAVRAIEKAILAELETGSSRNLLSGDNASDLIAKVGDVIIRFRAGIPTDWVSDGVRQDFTAEKVEAMTDAERCSAEWGVVQHLVAQSIDNGLPQDIWDDLCDRANRRSYDLYDVLVAYLRSRASCPVCS